MLRMKSLILVIVVIQLHLYLTAECTTEEEQLALQKLRPLVVHILTHSYMKEDSYLGPFLRTANLDVEKAADMIRNSMKWREQNKIDGILNEKMTFQPGEIFTYGIDKSSRPTILVKLGKVDVRKIVLTGITESVRRFAWHLVESLLVQARSMNSSDIVMIVDLNGVSLRKQGCSTCVEFTKEIAEALDANYPELAAAVFIVNTPRLFEVIMKILKAVLAERSAQIMHVYGYDQAEWTDALLEWIAPDQLKVILGSDLTSTIIQNQIQNFQNSPKISPHDKISIPGNHKDSPVHHDLHSINSSSSLSVVNLILVAVIVACAQVLLGSK